MSANRPFERAVVLGAGAVGSFLGARLSPVLPTVLVARILVAPDRARASREILRWGAALGGRSPALARLYAPDLHPVAPDAPFGDPRFLLVWRRIPLGTEPRAAWEAFEARVAELLSPPAS